MSPDLSLKQTLVAFTRVGEKHNPSSFSLVLFTVSLSCNYTEDS